jgi:hypothetical protein
MVMGTRCHLEVELVGDSKYNPCQDLEIISEAIEVIYAFAVGLEPEEVSFAWACAPCGGVPGACGMHLHGHAVWPRVRVYVRVCACVCVCEMCVSCECAYAYACVVVDPPSSPAHPQVAVNRVGCNTDGINVSIGFGSHVSNSSLTAIANGGPPRMMAATLAPFGLTLKSTTVQYNVRLAAVCV